MIDLSEYLEDIPSIQNASIVSKKLHVDDDMRVIGFAFAAGQELTSHTSPMNAKIYVIEGSARVELDGEQEIVGSGDSIELPATVPHGVQALSDLRMLLVMTRV